MGLAMDPITGGEAVVEALFEFGTQFMKLEMQKAIRDSLDKRKQLKLDIQAEWDKGYQKADLDAIASMKQKVLIYEDAIVNEVKQSQSQAKPA